MLCYEYFCEEKNQVPLNFFQEKLKEWLIHQNIDIVMQTSDLESAYNFGLNKITNYIKNKYIILFLSSFLMFSCGESQKVELTKEEYNKLKGVKQPEYPKEIIIVDNPHS